MKLVLTALVDVPAIGVVKPCLVSQTIADVKEFSDEYLERIKCDFCDISLTVGCIGEHLVGDIRVEVLEDE